VFLRIIGVAMPLVIASNPAFTQQSQKGPSPEAVAEYKHKLVSSIAKAVRYPLAACADKLEGSIELQFTASSDGRITSRRIAKSSGHAILDQEALQTIDRVKTAPPFPRGVKARQLTFSAPIHFRWPRFLGLLKFPCNPSELKKAQAKRASAPTQRNATKSANTEAPVAARAAIRP
jgi:TonB family protein